MRDSGLADIMYLSLYLIVRLSTVLIWSNCNQVETSEVMHTVQYYCMRLIG